MTEPSLEEMIRSIEWERPNVGELEHLTDAVMAAARLNEISDDLVGHFVEKARAAGASWAEIGQSMGTTRQAAQKRFVHHGRRKGKRSGFFLTRFAAGARSVVMAAQEEARRAGSDQVGTEHLLLAVTDDPSGVAARAIDAVGGSVDVVQRKARDLGNGDAAPTEGHIRLDPDSKKVLELSLREAIRTGEREIDQRHILLGLARDERSAAGSILASSGVRRKELQVYLDGLSV